jgi:hypothetical protein
MPYKKGGHQNQDDENKAKIIGDFFGLASRLVSLGLFRLATFIRARPYVWSMILALPVSFFSWNGGSWLTNHAHGVMGGKLSLKVDTMEIRINKIAIEDSLWHRGDSEQLNRIAARLGIKNPRIIKTKQSKIDSLILGNIANKEY